MFKNLKKIFMYSNIQKTKKYKKLNNSNKYILTKINNFTPLQKLLPLTYIIIYIFIIHL